MDPKHTIFLLILAGLLVYFTIFGAFFFLHHDFGGWLLGGDLNMLKEFLTILLPVLVGVGAMLAVLLSDRYTKDKKEKAPWSKNVMLGFVVFGLLYSVGIWIAMHQSAVKDWLEPKPSWVTGTLCCAPNLTSVSIGAVIYYIGEFML